MKIIVTHRMKTYKLKKTHSKTYLSMCEWWWFLSSNKWDNIKYKKISQFIFIQKLRWSIQNWEIIFWNKNVSQNRDQYLNMIINIGCRKSKFNNEFFSWKLKNPMHVSCN